MNHKNNATSWALSVFGSEMSTPQKLICLYLRTFMNDYQELAWPSVSRIAKHCSMGTRTVQRNLQDICKAGYLEAAGESNLGTKQYKISTPVTVTPPCHSDTPPPVTVTPELNKVIKQKHIYRPGGVLAGNWEDWDKYRRELKKTLTKSTADRQGKMLSGYEKVEQEAMIEQSITNGWTGLFKLKGNDHGSTNNSGKNSRGVTTVKIRDLLNQGNVLQG